MNYGLIIVLVLWLFVMVMATVEYFAYRMIMLKRITEAKMGLQR